MSTVARYDGFAEWYQELRPALTEYEQELLRRLLGRGRGTCIDVGCGAGVAFPLLTDLGWTVVGLDVSEELLAAASKHGTEVVRADATALPFEAASVDAAVSVWTHTDIDHFAEVVREVARVLRPGSPFVYVGGHPCFIGPHSRFIKAEGTPTLHPGYRRTERYTTGPAVGPDGLRVRVGAVHLPLGAFIQSFLDAGFTLELFEEDEIGDYPYMVALRWRR